VVACLLRGTVCPLGEKIFQWMYNFENSFTFWVLEVTLHAATARWQWGGFLLSSSLYCRDCLSRQFVYLNPLYNPAPQGNWPHSLTYYLLALNIGDCFVSGGVSGLDIQKMLPLLCLRSIWLQIIHCKSCWLYLEICTPFGNLHFELSNLG